MRFGLRLAATVLALSLLGVLMPSAAGAGENESLSIRVGDVYQLDTTASSVVNLYFGCYQPLLFGFYECNPGFSAAGWFGTAQWTWDGGSLRLIHILVFDIIVLEDRNAGFSAVMFGILMGFHQDMQEACRNLASQAGGPWFAVPPQATSFNLSGDFDPAGCQRVP